MTVIRPIIQRTNKEECNKLFRYFSFLLGEETEGMEKEQSFIFNKLVRIDPVVMMCQCMLVEDGVVEKDDGCIVESLEMKGENLSPDLEDSVRVLIPELIEFLVLEDEMICPVCEKTVKGHDFKPTIPVGVSSKLRVLDISKLDDILRMLYKKVGVIPFMYKF